MAANLEAPEFLGAHLEAVFEEFPEGSLWLVTVDPVLLSRLTFAYTRISLELTPDRPLDPDQLGVHALDGHSITSGVMFEKPLDLALLTFSPAVLGYAFAWSPHAVVLLFGQGVELRDQEPRSLASVFEPDVMADMQDDPWSNPEFWQDLDAAVGEALLPWWVARLNVLYSHAADPTRFELAGRHQAEAQIAWFLTLERIIADAILILSGVQSPQMARLEAAFDVLDKAEALLGYGRDRTGRGFQRLLRRSEAEPRLRRAWGQLPVGLQQRFDAQSRTLYEVVYQHVLEHSLPFRRVDGSRVNVFNERADALVAQGMNDYAPSLIRAARNSSHGFLDQLVGEDRYLLATHTGELPPQVADLAVLVALGLFADAERLVSGTWFE
jgi:hypothetical protein